MQGGRPAFIVRARPRRDAERELRHLRARLRAARAHAGRAGQRGVPGLREVRAQALGHRPSGQPARAHCAASTHPARERRAAGRTSACASIPSTTSNIIAYSKRTDDADNVVLTRREPRPTSTHVRRVVELPLANWGLERRRSYQVHDLLSDARYLARAPSNCVELNPEVNPATIFRLRRRQRPADGFAT